LPFASSLCGACYEACPVKIDIPALLVELRTRHVEAARQRPHGRYDPEAVAMAAAAYVMRRPRRFARAGKLARVGRVLVRHGRSRLPLPPALSGWSASRDLPTPPTETFREWWARR
jgi:L-lactate dehydrogenase complex protein LldF